MHELRFRQIHLDFHTSEHISGVGSAFDADQFAATLQAAHVDSINLFARCHHGWMYYYSQQFSERVHPQLTCNLLKEQIEACHARGILTPIYVTVEWDHLMAKQHPEWLVIDEHGRPVGTPPFEAGFYRTFCLNTPYVDFLKAHTAELCDLFEIDGFWFDICMVQPCCCPRCLADMREAGLDPTDRNVRARFAAGVLQRFQETMVEVVRAKHSEATIFFNSGHVGTRHRPLARTFTHFELESLPSGAWGYLHFPTAQRYARTLGKQTIGMNGKFHTAWRDFHSFKNPAALEFECMRMLALGAKCSVGDQLHPTGKICRATYDLIGSVYAKVEAAEPWCRAAEPVSEVAVLTPEEFAGDSGVTINSTASAATRLLQELRHQFDVVDSQADFSRYRALVLPDAIPVDESLAAKLSAFLAAGGKLLASHRAGLRPDGGDFALPELGVSLRGEAPYAPDFIVPGQLGAGLPDVPHVMYQRGLAVTPAPGAEVLSSVLQPYFNRTWEHFCSHQHTPADVPADYPGVVRNGSCVYFAHPLFSIAYQHDPLWCKLLLRNALDLLLPDPLLRAGGPSSALFTLNRQTADNRLVLHALHYIPERRAASMDIIEDIIPLYDVPVSVRAQAAAVALAPQGTALPFAQNGDRVEFTLPKIVGHQMVAIRGK